MTRYTFLQRPYNMVVHEAPSPGDVSNIVII